MAYDRARVAERFKIPEEGLPGMEHILTETECEVLDGFLPERFPAVFQSPHKNKFQKTLAKPQFMWYNDL